MATGVTSLTIPVQGDRVTLVSVLAVGAWVSPTVDTAKVLTLLADNGGGFERTIYGRLDMLVGSIAISTTTLANDTATATFRLAGEPAAETSGNPAYNTVHTSEACEVVTCQAGIIIDATPDESGAVTAATSVTNNSTHGIPVPVALFCSNTERVRQTGLFKIEVYAADKYGIDRVDITCTDGVTPQTISVSARTPAVAVGTVGNPEIAEPDVYAAEFDAADFAQGALTYSFVAYSNSGQSLASGAAGAQPNQTGYADPDDTWVAGEAWFDNRSTLAYTALAGGTIAAFNLLKGATSGAYAVAYEAASAENGTLTVTMIDNTTPFSAAETVNVISGLDESTTGVSFTASGAQADLFADATGVVGNSTTLKFHSMAGAARALGIWAETSGGHSGAGVGSKQNAGCTIYATGGPYALPGNNAIVGAYAATENLFRCVVKLDPAADPALVRLVGSRGSWSRIDDNVHYEFQNQIHQYCLAADDGIAQGSGDAGRWYFVDVTCIGLGRGTVHGSYTNAKLTQVFGLRQSSMFGGGPDTNPRGNRGCIFRNIWNSESDGDFCIISGLAAVNGFAFYAGMCVDDFDGGAGTNHSDIFQTTAGTGTIAQVAFVNCYSRRLGYQFSLSAGVVTGLVFENCLAEMQDDGDHGSGGISIQNENHDHLIIANCTLLVYSGSTASAYRGTGGTDRITNFRMSHTLLNAMLTPSDTGVFDTSDLPHPAVANHACHFIAGTGYGLRDVTGGTYAQLFKAPGNGGATAPSTAVFPGGYRPVAGTIGTRATRDNIDGLVHDLLGEVIDWDGGPVGALAEGTGTVRGRSRGRGRMSVA